MRVVKFATANAFGLWHVQACTDHDIPEYGYRQSDQEPQLNKCWTTAYVGSYRVTGLDGVFADLDNNADVTTYSLTVATLAERNAIDAAKVRQSVMGAPQEIFPEPERHREKPVEVTVDGKVHEQQPDGTYRQREGV